MKDNPREKLKRAKLVAITAQPKPGKTYLEMVKAALMGGAEVIQLREKQLSSKEFLFLAKSLKELCHLYGALFIVNDRLDLALASGADGAHLGAVSLKIEEVPPFEDDLATGDFAGGADKLHDG